MQRRFKADEWGVPYDRVGLSVIVDYSGETAALRFLTPEDPVSEVARIIINFCVELVGR